MRRVLHALVVAAVGAAALAVPAGAAYAIDPPSVRVTPGISSVLAGETRQLAATVTNLTSTALTWSVRSGAGTVDATGLYTAPAQVPARPVAVVRAASVEDPTVYGEATVAIASGVPGGAFGAEVPLAPGGGQDADMGDVTGDGKPDVVLLQNCCNSLSVWNLVTLSWNGTGLTRSVSASGSTYDGFTATNDFVLDLELGDLDGDGDLDVYVPFGSAQAQVWRYQVWRNNGTGTFTPDAKVRTVGGARSGAKARLTDFDGDGHLDAVRLEHFGNVLLERGNGNGTFQDAVPLMHTTDANSFDVGDLTGDGRPEVAVGIKGMSNSSTTIEVGINTGFGGVASEVTYNVGMAPEPRIADTDGDGWNDLVVSVGGEFYTSFAPRLLALRNLATGTGAVSTTPVQLLAWRPNELEAIHGDGDGVLDLAGFTYRGPVLLRRTGPNAYAPIHAASTGSIHHATWGDVTGDGRADVFTNFDGSSQFWPGSADAALAFSVLPTVTRVNATTAATFAATLRNSVVEPKLTWSASRGTFNETTYTAPATAAPSGTPVTVTATLTGTTTTATRGITVVNEKFQFTALGGQDVRQVVADPLEPTHLYAATATGVYRSTSNGVTFSLLGTTATTGTDARQVAVVRDPLGTPRAVAIFGSKLYRIDVGTGDWTAIAAPASATAVSTGPDQSVVWVAGGGQVHRSTDGATGFTALGQTSVTNVVAIDPTNVWIVRSAAPRVARGAFVSVPSPALDVTARELPVPAAAVNAIAVHPTDRTLAYVATNDAANPLFRDAGGNGNEGSPMWAAAHTPGVVDRLSVSPNGAVLAARATSLELYKSPDQGAAWHSVNRGFSSVNARSVAHRSDGLDLVGTSAGLYTPVESTPPAAPAVTGGPSGTTGPGGANAFAFTFDPVADAASYLCALDDASWAACTSPKSYSGPLATGSHTFSVVALDSNGNESGAGTRSWTVDATPPPVPTILTGPAGTVASSTASFTFELTGDAAGATCSLDGATPVSCASGVSYGSLAQGAHTFAVRSVDAVGNPSAPATRSWTVDTTPPAHPYFFQTPGWVTPSTSAFFQWQSDPGATYACLLDGAPVTCSASAASLSDLAEGPHAFRVTASDAAGNKASNEHTWRVDRTNPASPVITVKPDASTTSTTAYFEFASPSDDVSHYLCALDGVTQYCYGQVGYSLDSGTHTFSVRAVDYAGHASPPAEYQWTIAVAPPAITSGPAGLVNSRGATFAFTAPQGATTACSLDGAAPAPCTSGVTYEGLADGGHTFAVTATLNGATSEPATRAWTVDATAPAAPELTAVPPLRTTSGVATFGWTPDPALTYTCALDGAPVTCESGAYTKDGLGDGGHQFVLTARDAASNSAQASYSWTVDRTGPTVSVSTKPAARTAQTSATFEFGSAAADLHHYVCTVDGTAAACTSPLLLSSLGQGAHTFSVVAYDDLGNAGSAVTHRWTVDTTGPAVTLTGTPPARTALATATFTFSASASDLAGYVCTVDGVTNPCTSPVELSSLAAGPHAFSVVAKDDLGNVGQPATHEWTVDQSGPAVTLDAAPAARTALAAATFEFSSAAADVAAFVCTVDGVEDTCTSPLSLGSLADGEHTFSVVARDETGNTGVPATHTWTVDRTGPAVTMPVRPAAKTSRTEASFEFSSAAADVDRYECALDGAAYDTCASPVELTGLAAGEHTFTVVAYDDLGNAGAAVPHTWVVDVGAPDVTIPVKPPAWSNDPSPAFEFASSAADVASYECTLDGEATPCASPWTDVPALDAGPHTLSVVAVDDVGNVSATPATHSWTVDLTAPVATVATSAALTARHAVTFDEPVRGVDTSTVRLLLTGTATVVPAAVTCATATGTAVACTAETVRRASLAPAAPLTPGQLYTVSVDGVTDLAGNAAEPVTKEYRASVSEQENGAASAPAWRRVAWSGAKGGSFHVADTRLASATYAFTGTSVTFYGVRGPAYGLADVYVDDKLKASKVNFYSTSTALLAKTVSGLSNTKHTLKVVVRGERGSTSGKGTAVAVDAVKVGATVTSSPALAFAWGRVAATGASGGAYAWDDSAGATFTVKFRGRGIDWVTVMGPSMGKASVTIDGQPKGTFDNWASATKYGVVRRFSGLADTTHTLTIKVLGTRRSGATGTNVAVDRFGIAV